MPEKNIILCKLIAKQKKYNLKSILEPRSLIQTEKNYSKKKKKKKRNKLYNTSLGQKHSLPSSLCLKYALNLINCKAIGKIINTFLLVFSLFIPYATCAADVCESQKSLS